MEFWPGEQSYWGANMYDVYALLKPDTDPQFLNQKLSSLTQKYFLPSWIERGFADPQGIADNIEYELQPIQNIYLHTKDIRDGLEHGNVQLLWLFGFSGILIMVVAGVNFINLSTARYSTRAKEISMRKIVGATKKQLILQFLSESIMISFLAFLIGIIGIWALLPFANQLLGKALTIPWHLLVDFSMVLTGHHYTRNSNRTISSPLFILWQGCLFGQGPYCQ